MPRWVPERVWDNQNVFIIGGGKSLERFDWSLLKGKCSIGCNDAFALGVDVCPICVFGDTKWFYKHKLDLMHYKGAVFTNCPKLLDSKEKWLWTIGRRSSGLHKDALGWNFSTGALAINLALLLGAKAVYLLGFDMHLTAGRANWHQNVIDKPDPTIYAKFLGGMEKVKADLYKFPGTEIINVTDDSSLDLFPKTGLKEFWKG